MDEPLQHIDLSYLEDMAMGDASTKRRLLLQLQQQLPSEMQELQQFLRLGQWRKASGQLHLLQSTLQFAGCRPMEEAREQLQDCLQREPINAGELGALLESMQSWQAEILREIGAVLQVYEK